MKLDIVKHPAAILQKQTRPVDDINSSIHKLAAVMVRAQKQAKGYGIAAPQLGYSKAMFTFIGPGGNIEVAINPTIRETSGWILGPEGCLSLPGKTFMVHRPERVTLDFTDLNGRDQVVEASGLLARCFAHEIDHLFGVLVSDKQNE